jgi:hypothetical protein
METKKVRCKVSRVEYGRFNGGLEFLFDKGPYDAACRDHLASTEPDIEKTIEILRRARFTDPEISAIFDKARAAQRFTGHGTITDPVALPRPVYLTVTVSTRY